MGFQGFFAWQQFFETDVRFGSKADIERPPIDVRFTPKSGHSLQRQPCPLCAKSTYAPQQTSRGNSFGTSAKRRELSWTDPIERNVLARIRCPLKLEAERIDGTHHRFTPGYELSGSGFGAGRVHELRIFSR